MGRRGRSAEPRSTGPPEFIVSAPPQRYANSLERPRGDADESAATSDDEYSKSSYSSRKKKKFKKMFKKKKKKKKKLNGDSSVSSASATGRLASKLASPFSRGGISGEFYNGSSVAFGFDDSAAAQRRRMSKDDRYKVMPASAYPNTYLNREELKTEMNLSSTYYHDLRVPYKKGREIGQLRLEILQCFGLPSSSSSTKDVSAYCMAVCGSHAFKTDIKPPEQNPMWLSRMRRACMFPIFHAYDKIYIGAFDDGLAEDSQASDFIGRVAIDVARLRAGCMYDITLPLRQSAHVFSRQQQGSIRVRMHLIWVSERSAVMSYIPTVRPKWQPNETQKINCLDEKSFRNVANLVHGSHMPGKFSMTLLKATIRELNFSRIHIFRYIRRREIYNLQYWVYPSISGFVFVAWMHSVYANTARYIPGHILTFFLMRLYVNYAYYAMDSVLQNGFTAPSIEELLDALLYGSKGKRKKYIKALNMESDESQTVSPEKHMDTDDDGKVELSDIVKAMRKSVKIQTYKYRLRSYRNAFRGSDAVDFLTRFGYAYSRSEAVMLGRRLSTELKAFEHVGKKFEFDDEDHMYHFLDIDSQKYLIKGHNPRFKRIFQSLGFVSNDLNAEDDHVEFPFAEGTSHPRFTVKESLVARSAETKRLVREREESRDIVDCAEFGVAPVLGEAIVEEDEDVSGMFQPVGQAIKTAYRRTSSVATATMNATANLPQTVMNLPQNITQNIVHRRRTMEFGDPEELYARLKERHNPSLDELLESKVKAANYDPHGDDSDDDVEAVTKKKRKGIIIEEKQLRLPPDQDFSKMTTTVDKPFAKSMIEVRERIHGTIGHFFNDRVYKIDNSLFPTKHPEEKGDPINPKASKRTWMGRQRRRKSNERAGLLDPEGKKKKAKDPRTPYDQRVDEYEKILQINKYSHSNPWINRVAVVVQPIVEILQVPLFVSRAGFNLMTWQDPILSFWVAILGPLLVLFFHLMPYRILFGVAGVYLVGPQNWLYRLFEQTKPGYEPPNFNKIVKKRKPHKQEPYSEIQLFSSMAPGNQHIKFKNVDPQQVKQVVVPKGALKYTRFYDWPPEPEYARVYQAPPPRNLNIKKESIRKNLPGGDEMSDDGYESSDSYWYDATLARTKKKKKKTGLKKVAHQAKKGAGVVVGTTVQGAGAVVDITGAVVGTTVGATMGVAKATSKVTKKAVRGTAKMTVGAVQGTVAAVTATPKAIRRRSKPSLDFDQEEDFSQYLDDDGYHDYYE